MNTPSIVDLYHYRTGWCEEYGEYVATCHELPDLSGAGSTEELALMSLKQLIARATVGTPVLRPDDGPFNDAS